MAEIKSRTISFRDGRQLDRIDHLFSGVRLRSYMPKTIRGKRSCMTLWAIEFLSELLNGDLVGNLPVNDQEVDQWKEENQQLKKENQELRSELTRIMDLKEGYTENIHMLLRQLKYAERRLEKLLLKDV